MKENKHSSVLLILAIILLLLSVYLAFRMDMAYTKWKIERIEKSKK